MPITKSATKAAKRSLVLQKRNNQFKNRMKIAIKKLIKKSTKWEKIDKKELSDAYKFIDKSAKIWIIKKKSAARKKSRMAKLLNNKK